MFPIKRVIVLSAAVAALCATAVPASAQPAPAGGVVTQARLAADSAAHRAHLRHLRHREHLTHLAAAAAERRRHREIVVTAMVTGSPQQYAASMLARYGWDAGQMGCLDPLWNRESGWSVSAYNAGSGAYGIPQAVPGGKMASAGPDWQTDAATQIRWGLGYIKGTYGSPCGAWGHEEATGWY